MKALFALVLGINFVQPAFAAECQTKADCGRREYCGIDFGKHGTYKCKSKNDNPRYALNFVVRRIGDARSKTDVIKECMVFRDSVVVSEKRGGQVLKETTKAITPAIDAVYFFNQVRTASDQQPTASSLPKAAQPPFDIIAGDNDDMFLIDWENGTDRIRLQTYEAAWLRGLISSRCPAQ